MPVANLGLRFVLELIGVAAVAYAGLQVSASAPLRMATAVAAALLLVAVWAVLVAPKRVNGLSQPQKDVTGTIVLLGAATALGLAGQARLAVVYGTVVLLNAALLPVFGEVARHTLERTPR